MTIEIINHARAYDLAPADIEKDQAGTFYVTQEGDLYVRTRYGHEDDAPSTDFIARVVPNGFGPPIPSSCVIGHHVTDGGASLGLRRVNVRIEVLG